MPDGNCAECQSQVFGVAPGSCPRPSFQPRPILCCRVRVRHCDRRRRRIQLCCRQLVDPLHNVSSESVLIHPLDQRREIGGITCRKRFHSVEEPPEFFLVKLAVKIQTKQIIAERDIWRHLELLRKTIRSSEVMAFHSIIEQGAQGARPVRRYFAKPLERIPRVLALFSLFGTNLQCGEIKLIEVVVRFFLYRSCKLFLLLGKISFRTRQPACNDMKSCAVAISRRDSIERFARKIELPKPQRSGSVVELALAIIWSQSRYPLTPRNGVFKILSFRCVREDRQRLRENPDSAPGALAPFALLC